MKSSRTHRWGSKADPVQRTVMSQADPDANAHAPRRRWLKRRWVILGAAVLLALGFALFGRGTLAWWTRQMAARRLRTGALSAAERWLARSARFDPSNGRSDLVRATCLRRRYEEELWNEALRAAEERGAPPEAVERERQLGRIQAGTFDEAGNELVELIEAGASPHDVCAAFVHGYLARKDLPRAEMVIEAWANEHPDSPHLAYMRGICREWEADRAGDLRRQRELFDRAEEAFRDALAREPRHEPARRALAELLEDEDRLDEGLAVYTALAAQAPKSESTTLGLARVLRGLGLLGRARAALESLGPRLEASPAAAAQMGQIELESGGAEQAQRWLRLASPETTADTDTLRAAATAFAVEGNTAGAEHLLERLDREHGLWTRTEELLTRLATGPHDPAAAEELRRLSAPAAGTPSPQPNGEDRAADPAAELYARHCGGCHGPQGDGNGRAARHLWPKARDFRGGKFRLVSTMNGVPSREDLDCVLREGMPGTSMRAYDELADHERSLLLREVLRLHREGVREKLVRTLRAQEEEIDEEEVREIVDLCTTAGEPVRVPEIGAGGSQAVERGRETYFALGCDNCHGDDGTGVFDTPLYDDHGRPAPPRDLVRDPMKGGDDPASIYLRVVLGMPGTPHPAAASVGEDQLIDLVRFCRSLSREPKQLLTNHQRAVEVSRRLVQWASPGAPEP